MGAEMLHDEAGQGEAEDGCGVGYGAVDACLADVPDGGVGVGGQRAAILEHLVAVDAEEVVRWRLALLQPATRLNGATRIRCGSSLSAAPMLEKKVARGRPVAVRIRCTFSLRLSMASRM